MTKGLKVIEAVNIWVGCARLSLEGGEVSKRC